MDSLGVGPAPVSASVMLGSRKPLNRSHIPGTLDAAPPGIDCSAQASCSGAAICATRPALAPALNLLGHETAQMPARTHLVSWRHQNARIRDMMLCAHAKSSLI